MARSSRRQWLPRCRGRWSVESANHFGRAVTLRKDRELGRNARRACNLALSRSALIGAPPVRDGSINLSARTVHDASHPAAALRIPSFSHPTS